MVAAAAMAMSAAVAVSCASTDDAAAPTTTAARSRVITETEAAMLANLLVTNHDLGGADVEATVPFGSSSFDLTGAIDWVNHVGRLTVTPTVEGATQPSFDVVFNQTVVFEEVPGLAARLRAQARPAANWIARPLDVATSPLDIVLRLIDTAASTTRDNPVLIQSRQVQWLRAELLREQPTDVFRDQRTTYWVSRDDQRLQRLDAELEATSSTAQIDFIDHGPRTIDTPAEADIVALDSVKDLYAELRAGG